MVGPIGKISRGISSAIGLATEAYADHQRTKSAKEASNSGQTPGENCDGEAREARTPSLGPPPPYLTSDQGQADPNESSDDEDEVDWIYDETEAQLVPRHTETAKPGDTQDVDQLVAVFDQQHPLPAYTASAGKLPAPVIIPQRRPETKSRGFVRAYAPALAECGIDQSTFLDFHEGFHKATRQGGWFHASNIAVALSVMSYTIAITPSPIVHATALMVHTSIEAGRRVYEVKKTNTYLDQMNENLFKPRGLYAMIMTYKPESSESSELINIDEHISSSVYARQGGGRGNYRTASGKTHGAAEMPEACALIFPQLEAAPDAEKENAFKRAIKFTRDYNDRRAQATFEAKNPSASQLNVAPRQEFSSRFADPNHPVNQGGIITLLTGGAISPSARRQGRRDLRNARRAEVGLPARRRKSRGTSPSPGRKGGMLSAAKRKLHEGILYLMVVNMPSEEEMQAAADATARAREAMQMQR